MVKLKFGNAATRYLVPNKKSKLKVKEESGTILDSSNVHQIKISICLCKLAIMNRDTGFINVR